MTARIEDMEERNRVEGRQRDRLTQNKWRKICAKGN